MRIGELIKGVPSLKGSIRAHEESTLGTKRIGLGEIPLCHSKWLSENSGRHDPAHLGKSIGDG
ncbi:hypothetical protein SDC9_189824 [bioreactor metagenome]|uniref:Uncharacterized protein n=1 Tax=bioreactor metagenome TaxID=1076179 RepID=A0A645HTH7_9ZZZZ